MIFHQTRVKDLLSLEMQIFRDERGCFGEGFNTREFNIRVDQVNFSTSADRGTFRGLHYQDPNPQTKVVFCVRGSALDVVVDLRPESETYLESLQFVLTPESGRGVYVPPGFAHGWMALQDNSQIIYMVEGPWSRADERGVRHDDPAIRLKLPYPARNVAERDRSWPLLTK
jgi:dTDP-4-dehydrorhamnose 3,5-epimerase